MGSGSTTVAATERRNDFLAVVRRHLENPVHGWAIGTLGAIGEFHRGPDEPAQRRSDEAEDVVVTARGAIRIAPNSAVTTVAYEGLSARRHRWTHGIAFCLPQASAAIGGASVLTEVGLDEEAIRAEDREGLLFDLGVGAAHIRACVRVRDPDLLAVLRRALGRSSFDPDHGAMGAIVNASPHRIFLSRLGRVEVYQGIPGPDGRTPIGPHTHVLPKMLRTGRSYSATTPIPDGLLPCLSLFPSHPVTDGFGNDKPFDAAAHGAFQELLVRYGNRDYVTEKKRITTAALRGGRPEDYRMPEGRLVRAASRIALRQLAQSHGDVPGLEDWRAHVDATATPDDAEPEPAH